MRVLLLSAYAAHSHEEWRKSLQAMFPHWSWQVLTLPPRHFSWRVRGNALHWALQQRKILEQDYDLVLATSMVDLATLRGLVPALSRLATVLYFHENQFDYPHRDGRHGLLEAQLVSLYSALAADRVLFNSTHNRETFLAGCSQLLRRLPDYTPQSTCSIVREKSFVLPVPLDLRALQSVVPAWPGRSGSLPRRPLRLVWSARFEHDKGGDRLYLLLQELRHRAVDFELAVTGQKFRNTPDVFSQIQREFAPWLVHFGYLDSRDDYHALLRGADICMSTATHEFQGLAVLEAVACGCLPVVPDRLAYTEIYPAPFRYASHPEDAAEEARGAAGLLVHFAAALMKGPVEPPDVTAFDCLALKPAYQEQLSAVPG